MKNILLILATICSINLFSQEYDYIGSGNLTDPLNWVDQADGVTNPADFTVGNFHITNTTAVTLDASWVVDDNIIVEDGVNFTVDGTKTITGTVALLDIINTGTVTVTSTAAAPIRFLGTQSGGTVIINTTSGVYASTYNNLSILAATKLNGDTKTNNLTVATGAELNLNNKKLTIASSINCVGTLKGLASVTGTTATSPQLILNATSASTVAFTTGFEVVKTFSVNCPTASVIKMNSNLGINAASTSVFAMANSTLDISGMSLTVNSRTTTNLSGTFKSSSTSSISITSTVGIGAITGTLTFDATNADVGNLTLNRSGQTLIIGNNLTVSGTASLAAGTFDLNSKSLTLNGAITNGASIKGSTTSSLTIGGAGTITGSLLMDQTSAATRSLYDLTLNRSGQTLTAGNALEIRNSITPTLGTIASGGNITLKADATRSARVGVVGGSLSGNVIVETYAGSSGVTGWTNLSPSGVNGLTVNNWDGQFPMTCSGCINGVLAAGGTHFVSIQGFNEAGTGGTEYVELTNVTALSPGTGYWVYLGTGQTVTSPITITETGTIAQSTVDIVLTKTGAGQNGYNLVANPYASPVSWSAVAGDAQNSMIDGSAVLYSPQGGQITLNGAGASAPAGYIFGGVIPMGQGLYVNATSAGTMKFKESHKSTANTSANPLLKTMSSSDEFRLSIAGPYAGYDEALMILDNNATLGFDRLLDAYKVYNTPGYVGYPGVYSQYTTINSVSNNENYAINALPLNPTQNTVIPIRAKAMVTSSYTISPINIQNIPGNACVTLYDKLLNVTHDLRAGAYICNIADTTSAPRFELTICASNIVTSNSKSVNYRQHVLISQDAEGVFVSTAFSEDTKSTISAYNIMGQKIMEDKEIEGTEQLVHLEFNNLHNQLIIVKVSNSNGQTTKKVFLN